MISRILTTAALAATLAATTVLAQQNAGQGNANPGNTNQGNANQGNAGQGNAGRSTSNQGNTAKAAVNDALFAASAASGGLAEVTVSELGRQRATSDELKRFSQQMVDDHTRMNRELMDLAARKQLALPRQPDVRAQFCAQSLAGLSGAEFDRCYAKAQCVIHMDSVAMFEAEAERGQDPEMRALAARALPRIKEHLRMIKPIAERYEKEKPSTEGAASEKRDH